MSGFCLDELARPLLRLAAAGPRKTARVGQAPTISSSPSSSPTEGGQFRVLCLHGYVQNGEIFRQKTGSIRKVLKSCHFVYVDAPHSAAEAAFSNASEYDADAGSTTGASVGPRGWWHAAENGNRGATQEFVRPGQSQRYAGWEESLAFVREAAEELGPFHGVLAFSQGCAVAVALLREAAQQGSGPFSHVGFAVLIGGFLPRDPEVAGALRGDGSPLRAPSLHVSGAADELIPRQRSEELASVFEESSAAWFDHPGRHIIPTATGPFKSALQAVASQVVQPK